MLPKQENLKLARKFALEALANRDLKERASLSGGKFEIKAGGEFRFILNYLGQEIWVSFPQGQVVNAHAPNEPITLREEILIFHYLGRANGILPKEKWISFAEIPEGNFYHPVFGQRCRSPLIKFFGDNPDDLLQVSSFYGGSPIDFGDRGVKIQAFPYVPIVFILWRGDADFKAEGNILFDCSVSGYLSTEDIVVLTETVVWKLIKAKRLAHSGRIFSFGRQPHCEIGKDVL